MKHQFPGNLYREQVSSSLVRKIALGLYIGFMAYSVYRVIRLWGQATDTPPDSETKDGSCCQACAIQDFAYQLSIALKGKVKEEVTVLLRQISFNNSMVENKTKDQSEKILSCLHQLYQEVADPGTEGPDERLVDTIYFHLMQMFSGDFRMAAKRNMELPSSFDDVLVLPASAVKTSAATAPEAVVKRDTPAPVQKRKAAPAGAKKKAPASGKTKPKKPKAKAGV